MKVLVLLLVGVAAVLAMPQTKGKIEWHAERCESREWSDSSEDYLLAHENCGKFWSCTASGDAYEMDCPAGLHFSTKTNRCEWPKDAGCESGSGSGSSESEEPTEPPSESSESEEPTEPPSESSESEEPTEPPSESSESEEPTEPPSGSGSSESEEAAVTGPPEICEDGSSDSTSGEAGYLKPHSDCAKFWSCSNGTPYEMSCPDGTLWNDSIKVCDWPRNVSCESGSGSSEEKLLAFEKIV